MVHRYSLVCEDRTAAQVDALAREYGLTESEVLRQLIDIGLERREAELQSSLRA